MTKVTYIGDPLDSHSGPNTLEVGGVSFTKNVPVDVPAFKGQLRKIPNNTHFKVDGAAPKTDAEPVDEVQEDGVEYTADDLLTILEARKVKVPKKALEDLDELVALVEASGGFPAPAQK